MRYIPNADKELICTMLKEIGVKSIDDLFSDIPEKLRLKEPLDIGIPLD